MNINTSNIMIYGTSMTEKVIGTFAYFVEMCNNTIKTLNTHYIP